MDFYTLLDQVVDLLQSRSRVSYRALKRQFGLDDDYLEDLKAELIKSQRLAVDEDGEVLVWTGNPCATPASAPSASQPAEADHLMPAAASPPPPRRLLTPNGASSPCYFVIWWTPPPWRASLTRRTCVRSSGRIKRPVPG